MKIAKWSSSILLTLSLGGCSLLGLDDTFRDRSNDYQRSATLPHIDVPEELDTEVVGELFPIPQGGQVASYQVGTEFEAPRPRSVAVNDSSNEVKIQRLGDSVWILMSVPPGESWPRVRSFLSNQSIPTARADAEQGIIETGWFSTSDDESKLQQFLITLSQGVQLNTTEIEILQRSYDADAMPATLPSWPEASVDLEKETWMRDTLANELAQDYGLGTASLLGREIGAAAKVEIVTPENDNPYIDMRLAYDRVWASVGYALTSDGFTVSEKSLESGYYVTQYLDPLTEERSFFKRLFGIGKPSPISYRVMLDTVGTNVEVRVFTPEAKPMDQRETYIVLERIRKNLT